MEVKAVAKYIRISPKKMRPLANHISRLKLDEALHVLSFNNKKGETYLKEVIESAVSNAKNNFKIDKSDLYIKKIEVNQGPFFKRWRAVSKGAAHQYKKRTSQISVVLERIKGISAQKNRKEITS